MIPKKIPPDFETLIVLNSIQVHFMAKCERLNYSHATHKSILDLKWHQSESHVNHEDFEFLESTKSDQNHENWLKSSHTNIRYSQYKSLGFSNWYRFEGKVIEHRLTQEPDHYHWILFQRWNKCLDSFLCQGSSYGQIQPKKYKLGNVRWYLAFSAENKSLDIWITKL